MNPQSEPKQPCGNFGFAPFLKEFRFPLMGFRTFGRGIYECTWQETQGKGWQETQKKYWSIVFSCWVMLMPQKKHAKSDIWIDNKPHCPFHFSRHGLHIVSGMRSCELPLQGSFDHATLRESTLKIVTPIARVAEMLKVVKHTATLISIQRSTPPPKAICMYIHHTACVYCFCIVCINYKVQNVKSSKQLQGLWGMALSTYPTPHDHSLQSSSSQNKDR